VAQLTLPFILRLRTAAAVACVISLVGGSVLASRVAPPRNSYSAADDVRAGQQAAAEAERQLPLLHDEAVTSYVATVGNRLVRAIPPNLRHSQFRYTFHVVNDRTINAFALPGGPTYVNRGMLQTAHNEGEIAGVMAHELSHVALRHGTAQASKAVKYEVGAAAGQILGALIGGKVGTIVAEGSRFGIGAAFMRFSREYERQADIEGAEIMARAGYDPRDMARMFKTLEQQQASGPEWLSDHPNPGNRYAYISREAQTLRVANPIRDTRAFDDVQARLKRLPPAPARARR
jgi:predicted Zn-dependent protease